MGIEKYDESVPFYPLDQTWGSAESTSSGGEYWSFPLAAGKEQDGGRTMMHITAFIRSLRGQVRKLSKGVKASEWQVSLQKVISLGILSERVWAILYRDSFSEPGRRIHSLSSAINAHAIRRVSGGNRLMEMAMADEDYPISARSLRSLLTPPAARRLAKFAPMTADDLAEAKRIGLSFYVEMARAARTLGSSRVAGAIDEISRGERQALRQLLQTHVLRGRVQEVA